MKNTTLLTIHTETILTANSGRKAHRLVHKTHVYKGRGKEFWEKRREDQARANSPVPVPPSMPGEIQG